MTSASTNSTEESTSEAMDSARFTAQNVLPSPARALVTMIRLAWVVLAGVLAGVLVDALVDALASAAAASAWVRAFFSSGCLMLRNSSTSAERGAPGTR